MVKLSHTSRMVQMMKHTTNFCLKCSSHCCALHLTLLQPHTRQKNSTGQTAASKKENAGFPSQKKMIAIKTEYANALTYIDMFHSAACWHIKANAKTKFELSTSKEAKMDALKEQICINVTGFAWKDLHHPR